MKKLILVIMLVVMMTLGLTGMALAATSDTITVTATPAFVGISNSPATWLVNGINGAPAPKVGDGRIRRNIVYYANPLGDVTAPAGDNVTDAECQFSITNISTVHTDISVNFPDFVGGDAMTNINQDSGDVNVVNGVNAFVAWSWYSGMPYANKILAKATESDILLSDLGETTNKKWGLEIKTQTGAWTVPDSMISSVVVSAEEH